MEQRYPILQSKAQRLGFRDKIGENWKELESRCMSQDWTLLPFTHQGSEKHEATAQRANLRTR